MTTGIYSIQLGDVCLYVGQSGNIEKRWKAHRSALLHGRSNDLLQWVYVHHVEDFHLKILETCYSDQLDDAEIYWTIKLHPWCDGLSWASARTWGWPVSPREARALNRNRHFQ